MELSDDEVVTLYDGLKHQYISYENISFLDLIRRLRGVYQEIISARQDRKNNETQK